MLSHLDRFTALFLQLQAIQNYWNGRGRTSWTFLSKKICPSSQERQTVLHFKVILTELQNLFKDWSVTYAHPRRFIVAA